MFGESREKTSDMAAAAMTPYQAVEIRLRKSQWKQATRVPTPHLPRKKSLFS
jgi:hypothetical protein